MDSPSLDRVLELRLIQDIELLYGLSEKFLIRSATRPRVAFPAETPRGRGLEQYVSCRMHPVAFDYTHLTLRV